MKTRIFTLATAITVCVFAACGSGNGSGSGTTDSLKSDSAMPAAAGDSAMRTDTSMHKTDTSSLPK